MVTSCCCRICSIAPVRTRRWTGAAFTDPEKRKVFIEKFFAFATQANIMSDTRAFLDYLAAQPDVKPGPIGTTGYCMGGLMSLTAAGTYPDRIAATASYHGGRLATDVPESPHLLAPKMKSRVYVAGAIEDGSFPDEMKSRLEDALTTAGVDHTIETYPATRLGVPRPARLRCGRHGTALGEHARALRRDAEAEGLAIRSRRPHVLSRTPVSSSLMIQRRSARFGSVAHGLTPVPSVESAATADAILTSSQ